jgi:hypothetical protein
MASSFWEENSGEEEELRQGNESLMTHYKVLIGI